MSLYVRLRNVHIHVAAICCVTISVDVMYLLKVLDQYFRRASDGMKSNFVQMKGFNLLASQLKYYKVSAQLISALCSLALGQEVNLSKEQ